MNIKLALIALIFALNSYEANAYSVTNVLDIGQYSEIEVFPTIGNSKILKRDDSMKLNKDQYPIKITYPYNNCPEIKPLIINKPGHDTISGGGEVCNDLHHVRW